MQTAVIGWMASINYKKWLSLPPFLEQISLHISTKNIIKKVHTAALMLMKCLKKHFSF